MRKIAARGVIVLRHGHADSANTLDELLQDQLEMLDGAADALGIPVDTSSSATSSTSSETAKVERRTDDSATASRRRRTYAAEAERWAAAIQPPPRVRVAAVGALPHMQVNEDTRLSWNVSN